MVRQSFDRRKAFPAPPTVQTFVDEAVDVGASDVTYEPQVVSEGVPVHVRLVAVRTLEVNS